MKKRENGCDILSFFLDLSLVGIFLTFWVTVFFGDPGFKTIIYPVGVILIITMLIILFQMFLAAKRAGAIIYTICVGIVLAVGLLETAKLIMAVARKFLF